MRYWWWLLVILILLLFFLLLWWLFIHLAGSGARRVRAVYKKQHHIEYLIDGIKVFKRLASELSIIAMQPAGQAFAHMRFWLCDHTTILDEGTGKTFYDHVK